MRLSSMPRLRSRCGRPVFRAWCMILGWHLYRRSGPRNAPSCIDLGSNVAENEGHCGWLVAPGRRPISHMPSFEDNFSSHAETYAKYRPTYPEALFERLAEATSGRELAWDCGCGNGQSALALAQYFEGVIATDGSGPQIAHARRHDRVHYMIALAEASGIRSNSVDLITVSQALHWFDHPRFYDEVKRVLKPGGVIAAWCYDFTVIDPAIDPLLTRYSRITVGCFWPSGARLAHRGYREIPFPFGEISFPPFTAEAFWTLSELMGYLTSWSATQEFIRLKGYSPLDELERDLTVVWGDPSSSRRIQWPLQIRVGRQRP